MEKSNSDSWCVYVLKCRNNYLYIGSTNNLERRLGEHRDGKGSKFVRTWRPFDVARVIACKDGKAARQLEYRLKQLRRDVKVEVLGIQEEKIIRRDVLTPKQVNSSEVNAILNNLHGYYS